MRNITNDYGITESVVITNRMTATLPVEQTQSTFLDPILIGLKGLNGFGGAGKVVKVNSSNNALEYGYAHIANPKFSRHPPSSIISFHIHFLSIWLT